MGNRATPFVLALDQGGTKTVALLADASGSARGLGHSGGACHAVHGMAAAMQRVREACQAALQQAGVAADQVALLSAGMTGADWPHEYALLEEALRETTGVHNVHVVNDCMIALRAGTDAPAGAVLGAGTGLNAAVVSPRGEQFIYGYYVQDEDNGGTALGQLALRAVYKAHTGLQPPTALTQRLLDRLQARSVDDLLYRGVNGQLGEPSVLAPLVLAVAREGDPVAADLVRQFGQRLSAYIVAGLQRFSMLEMPVDVVLSGGIFKAGLPLLRDTVSQGILAGAPQAAVLEALYEPVLGALLLGLERQQGAPWSLQSAAIVRSAEQFGLFRR